jgi:biotin transporter BioY
LRRRSAGYFAVSWTNGWYLVAFPRQLSLPALRRKRMGQAYHTAVAAMAIGSAIILLGGWAGYSILTNTSPIVAFKIACCRISLVT